MISSTQLKVPRCQDLDNKINSQNCASSVAIGSWSGGRFMHYGQALDDEEYYALFQCAWNAGIRTFITADVYGKGRADILLGNALKGIPRESYKLISMIGHDFYNGSRSGNRGYPRFTDPQLRKEGNYYNYLEMAVSQSLKRLKTNYFDAIFLHNPDEIGYTNYSIWNSLYRFKKEGVTEKIGVAPGPANGFVIDLIHLFRNYGSLIDYCMAILNPLEPWPGKFILDECEKQQIRVVTRVADYGGVLFGHMRDDHYFADGDHRAYRAEGWVAGANEKIQKFSSIAERHNMSVMQLATSWALSQKAVGIVTPTFVKEQGEQIDDVFSRVRDVANTPLLQLSLAECAEIECIGDNTGCMPMKGASKRYKNERRPDEWEMRPELQMIAMEIGWNMNW